MAQYELTDAQLAALAAIGLAPATPAPAAPAVASPFALAGVQHDKRGKIVTDTRPDVIRDAANAAPKDKAQEWARQAARLHRVPGFSCTVDVVVGGVSMAAHGYAWPATPGIACKSPTCTGTIRA